MRFPFPIGIIPKTERLAEWANKPLEWGTIWLADDVLGLGEPSLAPTGSGDSTIAYVSHLLILILAALGAAAWTALDRRRTSYRALADATFVVLRHYLATMLLFYAFAKLTQFPPPGPAKLDERVGDLSPMGMLWTFMGSSRPYSMFAGFAEGIGGVLLLWRPTQALGALAAMAAMGNVVALNFCYDVPVKLFSMQLLVIAAVIFAPHARRLIGAMIGRAVPELPPRPRRSLRIERARLAARLLFLASLAIQFGSQINLRRTWMPPPNKLHGIWVVDRMILDGQERPPLLTDEGRWHKLHIAQSTLGVRPMSGPIERLIATLDPAERRFLVKQQDHEDIWRYTLTEGEPASLVLEGTYRDKAFRAELHREPDPLLVTRGFHWIQEIPFNH
jgi:hypothetical protein